MRNYFIIITISVLLVFSSTIVHADITNSILDDLEFNATGKESDIIHVDGNIFAIVYKGPGDDGFVETVSISDDGTTISSVAELEYQPNDKTKKPRIIHVDGNIFAIVYEDSGKDGEVETVSISTDGLTISSVAEFEFESGQDGKDPDIIHVYGTTYAIVYKAGGEDGTIKTVNISNLPNNIQKLQIHLANIGKCPQFSVGPIVPNPGPMLPIAEALAVKDVIVSKPNMDNIIAHAPKINI